MSPLAIKLYHRMPPSIQSAAAGLRGLHLRSWRYGPETDRLVREAIDRDRWGPDRWESWSAEHLGHILRRAASAPAYHRRPCLPNPIAGGMLDAWPILEKDRLRADPGRFFASGCSPRKMFHENSSGTTGKPVNVWLPREALRAWYALFEARCRLWHGVSRRDRWAILGGQVVVPVGRCRPPFWVWNRPMNQLYLSSYHLSQEFIPAYLGALRRHGVRYLLGYTSSLYALAQEVLRSGRDDLKMAVVLTNAEPLLEHERAAISEAFACPVRETYGMAEMAASASECEAGSLHLWPEVGHVEILDSGRPAAPGSSGEIIATGLLNDVMPLIRYRVGDRGAFAPEGASCPCGRGLPILSRIEGRSDDVLLTADGRRVGRLDTVFKGDLAIREAQIVQEALGRVRIRYAPAPGFAPGGADALTGRLRERMGQVEVILEEVVAIPRGRNGKFRAVVCEVPHADRPRGVEVRPAGLVSSEGP